MNSRVLFALALLCHTLSAAEVTSDGVRVHYESQGKGSQAVVLIHGWTCDLTFWRLNAPAIAATHRVLLIDLPGHGKSEKPRVDYTMSRFARSVEAIMRAAGVDKAVLVGHSMGVSVVRQFAREYPAKLAGAILVDGGVPRRPTPAEDAAKSNEPIRAANYVENVRQMVNTMFVPATPEAIREDILKKMLAAPQHVMVSAREGMMAPSSAALDKINEPVLFVFSKKPNTAPDYEEFLRAVMPKLEFHPWEGSGHFLMMEQPDRFNREVLAFLEKNHM